MPVLFNKDTGLAENLAKAQADEAIKSGTHQIPLVNEAGEYFSADPSDASNLIREKRYALPSPDQLQGMLDKAHYSSTGQRLLGAAENVARGALPAPAVTGAELASGLTNAEDIRGRENVIPEGEKALETIAGLVGGEFIPGIGQANLLGKIGKGIEAASDASTLIKVGTTAAKLATENALFQSGNELHKTLINDPNQTVTSALANIGLAGAIGAGVGGTIGSIEPLWQAKVGPKVEGMLKGLADHLNGEDISADAMASKTDMKISDTIVQGLEDYKNKFQFPENSKVETHLENFIDKIRNTPFQELSEQDINNISKRLGSDFIEKASEEADPGIMGTLMRSAIKKVPGQVYDFALDMMPGGGAVKFLLRKTGHLLGEKIDDAITPMLMKFVGSAESIDGAAMKAGVDFLSNAIRGQNLINKAAVSALSSDKTVLADNKIPDQKDRDKLNEKIVELSQEPEKFLQLPTRVGHYLPDHQEVLSQTIMKAVDYLNQIRPKPQQPAPLDEKLDPPKAQLANYERALDIAQQPLLVLDSLQKGQLTPQDIQHLVALYPALHSKLQTSLMSSIVDKKAKINYRQRTGLSMLMGQPLDSTLKAQSILSHQPATPTVPQAMQTPGAKNSHSMKNINKMAEGVATTQQARVMQKTGSMKA